MAGRETAVCAYESLFATLQACHLRAFLLKGPVPGNTLNSFLLNHEPENAFLNLIHRTRV
jgi:hypothetical protein